MNKESILSACQVSQDPFMSLYEIQKLNDMEESFDSEKINLNQIEDPFVVTRHKSNQLKEMLEKILK